MTAQIHVRCTGCGRDVTYPSNAKNLARTAGEYLAALDHRMDCYANSVKFWFDTRPGTYGETVLTTLHGRYLWSETLMDVSYIPHGKHRPRDRSYLLSKNNNREYAIYWAAQMAVKHARFRRDGTPVENGPGLNG